MLGDGCLQLARPNSKLPRLKIQRKTEDIGYLNWQYEKFKAFCISGVKKCSTFDRRTNKTYYGCYFYTGMNPVFAAERLRWYDVKKKIIPHDLMLTSLTVAIWFCDDGCLIKTNDNNFTVKFATNCFTVEEVERLASLLSWRYNESFNVYFSDGKPIIKAATKACDTLMSDIHQYIPDSMPRKKIPWIDSRLLK